MIYRSHHERSKPMLREVKNLVKTYPLKRGEPVKALNGISLRFPEKGLVFILGKSGSGKSTLLNVMGGLDKADEGEIIINGKSSKDFSGSEMDSYRNTYLGFIFQEYNILNDFSVKENIALAIELQHRKADEAIIKNILEEVDLVGYERRKPNELSGGQKQRVAIARALVKEPQVLFADEPTGALDSNTGKQVFETLKKLSQTRLVIVVSHDREFAEYFGDRVIELKDGVIISDIIKTEEKAPELSEGLTLVGDSLIRIEKGHKLTNADIEKINGIIEGGEEAYVSVDPKVNKAIAASAMIAENGNRQRFSKTDNEAVDQGEGDWKVIKSKFPFRAAFRMGAKSLRVKPFRLVMTIILSTIAFTLFGVASTMATTDLQSMVTSSVFDNKVDTAFYKKTNQAGILSGLFSTDSNAPLSSEEVQKIRNDSGIDLRGEEKKRVAFSNNASYSNTVYDPNVYGLVKADQDYFNSVGFTFTLGGMPVNDSDIVITKYIYESLLDSGVATEADIIGKKSLDNAYTICGVLDTKYDIQSIKAKVTEKAPTATQIISMLNNDRQFSFHSVGFVKNEVTPHAVIGKMPVGNYFGVSKAVAAYINSYKQVKSRLENGDSSAYYMKLCNSIVTECETIDMLFGVLSGVFTGFGVATAFFAALLFYNFISISINNKRREIGILRAVGARGWDVFKIYLSEAGIITAINILLALTFTFLISFAVNNAVRSGLAFSITVLMPGIIPIALIFGVAIGSAFISSFLPTFRLAHQKPVDAIREK